MRTILVASLFLSLKAIAAECSGPLETPPVQNDSPRHVWLEPGYSLGLHWDRMVHPRGEFVSIFWDGQIPLEKFHAFLRAYFSKRSSVLADFWYAGDHKSIESGTRRLHRHYGAKNLDHPGSEAANLVALRVSLRFPRSAKNQYLFYANQRNPGDANCQFLLPLGDLEDDAKRLKIANLISDTIIKSEAVFSPDQILSSMASEIRRLTSGVIDER